MPDPEGLVRPERGRDAKRMEKNWANREVVYTFDNGWTIERLREEADLKLEGTLMHHCAGSHKHWVDNEVFYLFSLREPDGTPHATILCKPTNIDYHKWPKPANVVYAASTYDGWYSFGPAPITFEGRELRLLQCSARGGSSKYNEMVQEWFRSMGGVVDENPGRSRY